MQEFYIKDDNIRLHAKLEMPEGKERCPLLIIFHGLTGHMEEGQIVAVAEGMKDIGFAALRVELYGHGQSEGDFKEHTMFKWIANAMTVIDYVKTLDFVTDIYLCGHSQGGLLAMIAAGMRADDIKAIILMAPALVIPDGARKGSMLDVTFDPAHIPDTLPLGSYRISGNYFRCAQLIHAEDAINRYPKPVLFLHGDKDTAVPLEYSINASKLYKNSQLVILPDDNHDFDLHLDTVVQSIQDFLLETVK